MLREIVLLTGEQEGPYLGEFLRQRNPALTVTHVQTRDELTMAMHPRRPGMRLIAFCTSIIVPADRLAEFECRAYNFHPGPPNYPGRHPASFAIYEGAPRFGATAHEMHARVDSGPIIGAEWFDMPSTPRLAELERLAFEACIRLWTRLGPALASQPEALPATDIAWSGHKSSQADLERLCTLPPDIDAQEFDRRKRAFADGLTGRLTVEIHGQRFRIEDNTK
jgi:methionyl-tRNA formyltransferase